MTARTPSAARYRIRRVRTTTWTPRHGSQPAIAWRLYRPMSPTGGTFLAGVWPLYSDHPTWEHAIAALDALTPGRDDYAKAR